MYIFFSIGRVRFYHMPPVFLAAVKRGVNGQPLKTKGAVRGAEAFERHV